MAENADGAIAVHCKGKQAFGGRICTSSVMVCVCVCVWVWVGGCEIKWYTLMCPCVTMVTVIGWSLNFIGEVIY